MSAGDLSDRCDVFARENGVWVARGALWATIEPRGGAAPASFEGQSPPMTFRTIVRAPHALKPGMRLRSGALTLRILTIGPPRRGFSELRCEEDGT